MSKDTLTICGMLLTGIIGLAGLLLHQGGSISDLRGEVSQLRSDMYAEIGTLRSEMRTEIRLLRTEGQERSTQIKDLQQRVARIEGLLEGVLPTLASSATPPT
ncbi:MAG: hypothetical protein F4Y55_00415 [Gammaproteobacteria bacterium]|nr:hypothetical protein [Gammaproteobacteria bacterium]